VVNISEKYFMKEVITLSRPLWHRKVLVKIWPARHFLARMTRWPFFGWLIKRLLFEGDYLTFLPSEEAVRKKRESGAARCGGGPFY